jgi:hypothetical protein
MKISPMQILIPLEQKAARNPSKIWAFTDTATIAKCQSSTKPNTVKYVRLVSMGLTITASGLESASAKKTCGSLKSSCALSLPPSFMPSFFQFRAPKYKESHEQYLNLIFYVL